MAVNKIIYNKKTLIDLTNDTVTADKLFKGVLAHDKSGNQIVGTFEQSLPTGTKTITANGTYDVTDYATAKVNVPVPNGYVKPSGTKYITTTSSVDVTSYATAQIQSSTLTAKNIKKGVNILGTTGTYEGSGGGGLDINGIIKEYQVYAGENISAGDFVEFITNTYKALNSASKSCNYPPSCILLEDNKLFIAHSYSSSYYLYGTIVQISGTTMTATTTQLSNTSQSCCSVPSCILLENNKVFIAHSYGGSYYLYGTIVQISGTTMSPTTTKLNSTPESGRNAPSCTLLENNKVFIAHSYGSSIYLYGTIVQISGTTMTATTTQLNSTSRSCRNAPSCTLLENNKVFIAHSYSSSYCLYGTIVQISGTTMSPTTTKLNSTPESCRNTPSCTLLENNKVFIAHSYSSSIYLYGTIVQISGTTMSPTTTQLNSTPESCYSVPSCILLENNKLFIAHSYSSINRFLYGTIAFNNTYATPYNSTINGIAKTSGTAGETIEVYVPN